MKEEEKPIISTETMVALLGRPLSETEAKNYELYLEIAVARLDDLLCDKVEKLEKMPSDLQLLLARMFDTITTEQNATVVAKNAQGISSEKVEDYSVVYRTPSEDKTPMKVFIAQNRAVLAKYSKCGGIRSGKVTCDRIFPI